MSLPEIDGAIEPIIYAGREGATGRSVPLADRVQLVADRALKVSVCACVRVDATPLPLCRIFGHEFLAARLRPRGPVVDSRYQ